MTNGIKLPIKTVYRAANLLPKDHVTAEAAEEIIHIFNSFRSPVHKRIAIDLIRALLTEEENEPQEHKGAKRRNKGRKASLSCLGFMRRGSDWGYI